MSLPRSLSLIARTGLLSGLALSVAVCAGAQSAFSNQDLPLAPGESSSSSSQFASQFVSQDVSQDSFSGAGPLRAAAASLGSDGSNGGAAAGQDYGSHHNMFHSLAFEASGGANGPVGDSNSYITWGGNFTVGGGLHFSQRFSLLAEYQFIDDKLPGNLIAETGANGGNAHLWSLTFDPVVDLAPKRTNSVYVTGGGGFYRKVTNFTDPQQEQYCEYYYCGIETENVVVGHFSSNQGGWNVGGGFTHRVGGISGDGQMKVFAELRYLDVDTPAVTSNPNGLGTTTVGAGTKLLPISFGVRW
jgi:hypothetical protein